MFALLDAREDGKGVTLCFASKAGAQEFKQFALTYMEESGAGNGYGAYWVYQDTPIMQVDMIPPSATTRLKEDLVSAMRNAIIGARVAGDESAEGGIIFWSQELPQRQRPIVGDMFRSLFSQGATERIEGRVIDDEGDMLKVISWQDEGEDGKPIPTARIVTIPATQVMRIADWRRARASEKK